MTGEGPVVHEVEIAAPPEAVFPYLVDPERIVRWLGVSAELDPRPGGLFRVDVNGRDVVRGEYLEVDPPHRAVFTWGWEREGAKLEPGASTVEITLTAREGGTLLRLVHRDLPDEVRGPHRKGWAHYLDRLRVAGAGGEPGPDPLASPEIEHGAPGSAPSDILEEDEPERGDLNDERGGSA